MSKPLWKGTCRSRWATPAVMALLALAVVVALTSAIWSAAILVLGAAATLLFRRIVVTIDRRELVVRFSAPWSWPMRIARKDIESASSEPVNPLKWGGYGYRGSLRLFKRAAIVLRKGDALRLKLKNGRTVLITVEGAAEAAAVLEA